MPDRVLLAFLLGLLLCAAISSLSFAGETAPPAQSPGVSPPDKDSGVRVTAQPNNDHLAAVRVHLDPQGEYPLTETAPQAPDRLLWTVGLGGLANKVPGTSPLPRFDREGANLYTGIKVGRFSGTGELFQQRDDTTDTALSPDLKARGFYAQAGVCLIPGRLEVGARRRRGPRPEQGTERQTSRAGRAEPMFQQRRAETAVRPGAGSVRPEQPGTPSGDHCRPARFERWSGRRHRHGGTDPLPGHLLEDLVTPFPPMTPFLHLPRGYLGRSAPRRS